MRVVITQSNYIPWKGYFDLCNDADTFVFLDNVQFTPRDWRTRNKIKTAQGSKWLTIPVGSDRNRLISDVVLPEGWAESHWKTIRQSYSKTPYFSEFEAFFERMYIGDRCASLSEFNQKLIRLTAQEVLGIKTEFRNAAEFDVQSRKQDLILDILKACGATSYVSGPAAKAYIDAWRFEELGIDLIWKDYSGYPEYEQPFPPFEHAVSILDTIFCCGRQSPDFIWGWRQAEHGGL